MKNCKDDYLKELEEQNLLLETRIKHLTNDLRLTREENETSTRNYFEIYSNMEKKVEERTRELEELQRELQEKSQELEIMLDSSPAMIFFKDAEQRYVRVNKNFSEILGLPISEIIGKKDEELFSGEALLTEQDDQKVLETGEPILHRSEVIQTSNGNRQLVIDRIPYKDLKGEVKGIISFALDVTEAKRVEAEKRKLEAQFQQAQRLEAVGTLAGGIAHNFNNLLMGIQGNVALMLVDTEPVHPHFEKMKVIEKLIQSGSKLTAQLLGYAREGQYEIKPVNLNQVVKDTADTFGSTKKEIRIHRDFAEDLLAIEADQAQIEQALLNLFVNAADAMPAGGDLFLKTMNISHEDLVDRPYKAKPGNYVLVSIRDTGVGMDKKTMEHIFEPFYTSRGLGKGTGLGLASVYGIVKAHGGYIDVYSEKGCGATFRVYLPATEKSIQQEVSRKNELTRGRETVLFIDDEDTVAEVGDQMLKKLGYEVIMARSGKEAIAVYETEQEKIDMVILDMVMPDISGGEVYDRIKQINPDVKVLLSSGYSIEGQAAEILDRGCDGFIQKPFNLQALSVRIREVLEEKRVQGSCVN